MVVRVLLLAPFHAKRLTFVKPHFRKVPELKKGFGFRFWDSLVGQYADLRKLVEALGN